MKPGSRPWIDGTFQGPDEVMELLALHLHRLGAAQAKVVVFLADGAPWIWERLAWVQQRVGLRAGQVAGVLDCCHAVHHVSLALEGVGLAADERQRWYRELRRKLRAGQAYQVTAELSLLAEDSTRMPPPGNRSGSWRSMPPPGTCATGSSAAGACRRVRGPSRVRSGGW